MELCDRTVEILQAKLTLAAVTAIADYAPGSELDIFSDLQGEDFCHYPDEDFYNSGT
ncbi:MAG: hypothetical protein V7K50_20640 [Nostoc sp.]|uniref:hypothetical protein n=1 Tax=Nostoc sp. TaxID=1180 RepID=UPI002FF86EB3